MNCCWRPIRAKSGDRVAGQMPCAHVREPLGPVELLTAGHDVEAGIRVDDVTDLVVVDLRRVPVCIATLDPARRVHVVSRDTQINAAEGIHDLLESVQVDIEIVIDLEPGQVADRLGHQLGPPPVSPPSKRGVDLVHPMARDVDPEIARERQDDRLLQVGIRVDEHDRVRPRGASDVGVVTEMRLLFGGESGPRVRPKQEVVAGALRARARGIADSAGAVGKLGTKDASSTPTLRSEYHRAAVAATASPPTEKETPRSRRGHGRSRRWSGWGRESSSPSLRAALGRRGRGAVLFTLRFRGSRPVTVG